MVRISFEFYLKTQSTYSSVLYLQLFQNRLLASSQALKFELPHAVRYHCNTDSILFFTRLARTL